jgi:hypothetical protein
MFLNIITACSRPENLLEISRSINIPNENYRWLVIFDMKEFPNKNLIPNNCEIYCHQNPISEAGHSQRNHAIELINDGHVYMNDDDTILHKDLWENIKDLDHDFISFSQKTKQGQLRLIGNNINVGHIDSHNFIVSRRLIGDDRWIVDKYDSDGYFANKMVSKLVTNEDFKQIFIPKTMSIYNSLR